MKINTLTRYEISCALVFSIISAVLFFVVQKLDNPLLLIPTIYLLLNGQIFAVVNWRLLSCDKNKKKIGMVFTFLLLGAGLLWLKVFLNRELLPTGKELLYAQTSFCFTTLIAAFFFALREKKSSSFTDEEAFYNTLYNFFISTLVYWAFVLLSVIIIALGFMLLELLHINLWDWLGDFGQSLVIGFIIGTNLLFLNLIKPLNYRTISNFIIIFPIIIVSFASLYLLLAPFVTIDRIDSSIRLTTALILWLILLFINNKTFFKFNVFAAIIGIILTILSLRGIAIRINEYGWTINRMYVVFIVILLLLGQIALLVKSFLDKKHSAHASRILPLTLLIFAGGLVIMAMLPVTTWHLQSQVALYTTGGKSPERLLYRYHFSRFGVMGERALEEIHQYYQQHNDPRLVAFNKVLADPKSRQEEEKAALLANIIRQPADLVLPDAIKKALADVHPSERQFPENALIFTIDANHDGKNEFIALLPDGYDISDGMSDYVIYFFSLGEHGKIATTKRFFIQNQNIEQLKTTIKNGRWHYRRPDYDNLVIEGLPIIDLPDPEQYEE